MAVLVLEDGTVFDGEITGAEQKVVGELVFNTGMSGYQEILTDPSYYGQIVMMTYPLIGNYGTNDEDIESVRPWARGFIVREFCDYPSNWMNRGSLSDYLKKHGIVGFQGIDTRALTKKIREKGSMMCMLSPYMPTQQEIDQLKDHRIYRPVDMVTTQKTYTLPGDGYHIAVIDFGLKQNILQALQQRCCKLTVFPANTPAQQILAVQPDGIMLTNGPGDPKDNVEAILTIKTLMNSKPIFGICLGHQLLALAAGAETGKLKYGHRGCNHPVKDLRKNRIFITSQNHGYTVLEETIDLQRMVITHRNLNDGTIEGISYKGKPIFSVQFHPEASPGPQDTDYLFDEFLRVIALGERGIA